MKRAAPDVSALANAAHELLRQGDAAGAERVLSPVYDQLKSDPSVLHLMGLIKKAQNKLAEAELHLRSAIAYALSEGAYYNDLGVVLLAQHRHEEAIKVFRAALALLPEADAVRVNLTRCLISLGELENAEQEARAYIAASPGAESWTLLSQVQRARERNDEALEAADQALRFAPEKRGLRHNYAIALERAGRSDEALLRYESLAKEAIDSPDLALNFARALYAANRRKEAEQVAELGLGQWPENVGLHTAMARMRSLRGEGEASTRLIEAEIERRPANLQLRLACADALHRSRNYERAARVLFDALRLAPEAPPLLTAYGFVLDELNRPVDAVRMLQRVVELNPDSAVAQRNILSTLLRVGRADEALQRVRTLRAADADDQFLIGIETTALRLVGDPAYGELCDYDAMIRSYEIPAPRGFFTQENFNASLADALRVVHRTKTHPLDQSLDNGTQTAATLLASDEPNIKSFTGAVDAAIRRYLSGLPKDQNHPLGRRKRDRYRFSGLWSVRLGDGGHMPNHVHDRGWISSAYIAAHMPAENSRDPNNGHLKFGEPTRPIAGCGAERSIAPKPGQLVLFPSYFWHGVAPFAGAERLSLAFDVIPA